MSGQQHAPASLYPLGKTRYPLYRRLGGPQGQSGWAENLFPTGIRSRTVQAIVAIPSQLPGPDFLLYECKTWSLTQREEHMQKESESSVLMVIYIVHKREEVNRVD